MHVATTFTDRSKSPCGGRRHARCLLTLLMIFTIAAAEEPARSAISKVDEIEKTDAATDDPAANALVMAKLKDIVIPVIDFENTTLAEAIDFIRIRMVEMNMSSVNPAEKGIRIVVRYPRDAKPNEAEPSIKSLKLRNVAISSALQQICDATGYQYSVNHSAVILEPVTTPISPSPTDSALTSPAASTSISNELSKNLSPLVTPDLESAKLVISHLEKLAASKNGAEKVAIQVLSNVIKNTFTAEYNVVVKAKAKEQAEVEARRQDHHAREWLKPNTFGTVNKTAAKEASMKAEEIRKKASDELANAREKLILQLRDADAAILIYYKRKDYAVVSTLASTMLTINERSLPDAAYQSSFTRAQIASLVSEK